MAREDCRLSTKSSGCEETDKSLWLKTLEERDKGWLVGPLEWDDLGPDTVVSRRFPLQQGTKIRPIDDYYSKLSECHSGNDRTSLFFLHCRIALDSCGQVIARKSKRDRKSAHLQESNKNHPTQHKPTRQR